MFKPKSLAGLLVVALTAIVGSALFAPMASAATPKEGYEQFAGCPSLAENSSIVNCVVATVTSGHFQMGSKDVPITDPIILRGGVNRGSKGVKPEFFYNSEGGLRPSKQEVPGGIVGLTGLDWLINLLNAEQLKLYAETELAGKPGNPLENTFYLPLKVHLVNSVLGNNCYVGSESAPIELQMTRGTTAPPPPNEPISGKQPTATFNAAKSILELKEGTLVENAFAAPGANGCRLELGLLNVNIDSLVNSVSGLPAAAGTNETIQNFEAEVATPTIVYGP